MTEVGPCRNFAVIGGGMCGMTIALRLAEAGHAVTLYEAADRLGGLADAWELDGITWDRHYHVTLLSDAFNRKLLGDLGLSEELQWRTTRTGYFSGDRLVSMSNALEYLRLPGLGPISKMRLAWTILHASRLRKVDHLDRLPVENWLRRLSGEKVLDRLWRPLLRAKLGDRYPECSASFLWATIQRLYAARNSGLKTEMFGYVRGGYATTVSAFRSRLEALGVALKTGTRVEDVRPAGEQWCVAVEGEEDALFERVVTTTTPRRTARICSGLSAEERQGLEGVEYQGLVCASLLLREPLADYYLTYLMEQDLPFTAVVEMSSFVDPSQLDGKHLVYLPLYLSAEDPRFRASEEDLRRSFLEGLHRIYPHFQEDHVEAFRVSRVAEVFPLPVLGLAQRIPPANGHLPGLSMLHATQIQHGTLNVNETVGLAERAAASLLRSDGLDAGGRA